MKKLLILVTAVLLISAWAQDSGRALAGGPLTNDDFANATVVTGIPYKNVIGNTSPAGDEGNDPDIGACSIGSAGYSNSVWYTFTPSTSQTVEIRTNGSSYDTVLVVFTGTKGNLAIVDCNDDKDGGGGGGAAGKDGSAAGLDRDSFVKVFLNSGTKYSILVGEWSAPGGGLLQFNIDKQGDEPGEVDPYKCYSAFGFPSVREWVLLGDQFDEKEAWVDRPVALCNPAFKEEPGSDGGAAGNFVEEDNLVCFRLRQDGPEPGLVVVENQFGEQELDVGRAERLCVRSEKGQGLTTGSGAEPGIVPNFKCYKARRAQGAPSIGSNTVLVDDQYGEKVTRVFWPTSLCTSVDKLTNGMTTGEAAGRRVFRGATLVCYRVFQPLSGLRFEIVQNQFGMQLLLLYRAESLCVPSFKGL